MGRMNNLEGVRIVDLSIAVSGPFGSQLLADLGADVLKIEQPDIGDITRDASPKQGGQSFYHLALNRNKKSIALDLRTASGRQALHDLAKLSAVIYDNFRPGVLAKLGADYDTLRAVNPRIISCSVTGYGPTGPYAQYPSFDDMAEGLSGAYSMCGEPGGRPIRMPTPIADLAAGFSAAAGILSALVHRDRTGQGQRLEVNMLDALMYMLGINFEPYFITGNVPQPRGSRHPIAPMVGIFQTRDGFLVLGPCWPRIARIIGKEWMIDDPRFSTVDKRFENKDALEDLIEDGLRQADTADWLELMHAEDIPAGPINTLDKVINDPQVLHNRSIVRMEHPAYGTIRAIESPIRRSEAPDVPHSPPATLGENTQEVLRDLLGYTDDQIAKLLEEEQAMRESDPRLRRRL